VRKSDQGTVSQGSTVLPVLGQNNGDDIRDISDLISVWISLLTVIIINILIHFWTFSDYLLCLILWLWDWPCFSGKVIFFILTGLASETNLMAGL